jgi:sugar/nucleoside kinase (ribokinase family)
MKSDLVHIRGEAVGVGGGACNVALDLAAFATDLPILPLGLIGDDRHGQTVQDALRSAGLPTRLMVVTDAAATAHTHVMTVPGDSRTFFYYPGTNDLLDETHLPVEVVAGVGIKLFYLGYINLMGAMDRVDPDGSTAALRVLQNARAAGMITCVDLVSADTPDFRRTVEAALPAIDYLFLNEVEAQRATGLSIAGPQDRDGLLAAARRLQALGAGTVILHTAHVSLWLADQPIWAEALRIDPAEIVSPVGAGDAFCAGCLYGIHEGWPVERSLHLAHRAAVCALRSATATEGIQPLSVLMG